MNDFGFGQRLGEPRGETNRQAVAALRGYAYQIYASALSWLSLADGEVLHLEVAKDFAVVTRDAMTGTEVKDTAASGRITLRSSDVRDAIDSFVELVRLNPSRKVWLHYLTTAEIGCEKRKRDRIAGGSALAYWRRAVAGDDVLPLRSALLGMDLRPATKDHIACLSEAAFRSEFLSRIYWRCGAPGLGGLRDDLDVGMVEYVSSNRRLSSDLGKSLVPVVIEQVLTLAARDGGRGLRRADLLTLIDASSRVSVPIERLPEAFGAANTASFVRSPLLLPASGLPRLSPVADRTKLVTDIDRLSARHGAVFAVGATGLGKSLAACLAADRSGSPWSIVHFRGLTASDTAERLSLLLGELAVAPPTGVILDDLNQVEDRQVRDLLSRIIVALRRRYASAIVTAYASPAPSTLHALAPGGVPVVTVPYLDEAEVADLVVKAGGDAGHARRVYLAAAGGHPQLTMSILLRLSEKGWSASDVATLLVDRPDVESERRATLQGLLRSMPTDAMALLLRASLVEGDFDRSLALALGGLPPPLPLAGLVLEGLIGPWIEPSTTDRLRVSPLLEGAGREIFTEAERRAIHFSVADNLLRRRSLSVFDADTLLRHALGSADASLVMAFASSVVTCDEGTLEMLAPFAGVLRRLDCARPAVPLHPAASAMIRLAQLLVLLPQDSSISLRRCWDSLQREIAVIEGTELPESMVLARLLMHPRAGSAFPEWLELLLRLDALAQSDETIAVGRRFETASPGGPSDIVGTLLALQMRNIRTVASFRSLLERLDREPADVRGRCLSAFIVSRLDPSILVNQGWMQEASAPTFDWAAAADHYGACAGIAISWGNTVLAIRCTIAEAICIDEFGEDSERALACLARAELRFGFDVALGRARARVHWRRRDHAAALPLLTAASDAGGQAPLERFFIAREAGISTAELGDWSGAERWFSYALAALSPIVQPSLSATAIGLRADMGHAACRAGEPGRALQHFRAALALLPTIDPDGPLTEAYCHRIVRNGVLWYFRTVSGIANPDDRDVAYVPGCGSNVDPNESIRGLPVRPIDYGYYLLASADLSLPQPSGYHRTFRADLTEGPILSAEIALAAIKARRTIMRHEAEDFAATVRNHASATWIAQSGIAEDIPGSATSSRRGSVPPALIDADAPEDLRRAAEDFCLTFAIVAAIAGQFRALDLAIELALGAPELGALRPILERMSGRATTIDSDVEGAAVTIDALREDPRSEPALFLWCGIWLLFHVRSTSLADLVSDLVISWIFEGWRSLVHEGRFLLAAPNVTAPAIESTLATQDRSPAGAAALLLAAVPAAATRLRSEVEKLLVEMATERSSSV